MDAHLAIYADPSKEAPEGGGGSKKKGAPPPAGPFEVEPTELHITPGETQEVTVRAFPSSPGEFTEQIICCIRDNPDPVLFGINCIGAAPALEMAGPWQKPVVPQAVADGEDPAEAKPIELPDGVHGLLDFQRLLLNRMEEQTFSLANTCTIPVRWRINTEAIAEIPELSVFPSEGVLEPGGKVFATVTFRTTDEERDEVSPVLIVEFADNEVAPATEEADVDDSGGGGGGGGGSGEVAEGTMGGGGSEVQELRLMVKAEAYKICLLYTSPSPRDRG